MKISRFGIYLIINVFVILMVFLVFSKISDKKIAALVASTIFLFSSGVIFSKEMNIAPLLRNKWVIYSTGVFFVLFAGPIALLRILNWNVAFSDLRIVGISAEKLHSASTYAFAIMQCVFLFLEIRERSLKKAGPNK